jgi:lipoate-protein ligase B
VPRTERGGRATYHAPGQLVLYPIVSLAARGIGVERFVWTLEELMLEIPAAAGVHARRDSRGRGIWTERGKLGAVGIRVRDGVTLHGLALNVCLGSRGLRSHRTVRHSAASP